MPGFFDNNIVTQIQQANDIVDVISEHVGLKRKGREMVGLCPFHEDHRPSMNVSPAKQIFKCFACGAGGDVFKFVQMRENLTFPQAIERLADRASIRLPAPKRKPRPAHPSGEVDRNELARVNAWAAKYFQKNLFDKQKGARALDYLAKREISKDSIKKWQLGLSLDSPDDLLKTAHARKIPTALLEHAGLITAQNQDKFINRLMFTITDVTSRIIAFGGRALGEQDAKYINSPTTPLFDKSNSLYGLEHARHRIVSTDTAVVVEGYTDCIMAHQFGFSNVVAALGTSFTTGQGRLLRRYAKKLILIFDSDTAGIEAANRALDVCISQRIDIKLAFVPQGKDPCDFLIAGGKDKFQHLLESAVDVLQFKWDRLSEKFSSDDTLSGRKVAVDEFLQTIATSLYAGTLNSIETGLLINRLSAIVGLDSKAINAALAKAVKAAQRTTTYSAPQQDNISIDLGHGLAASAQREILEVLLNKPNLFNILKKKTSPALSLPALSSAEVSNGSNLLEYFDIPALKATAAVLFETLSGNPEPKLTEILAKTESPQLSSCITQLQADGEEKGNFESRLKDAIDALLNCFAKRKIEQLKSKQDSAGYLESVTESARKENRRNIGMT